MAFPLSILAFVLLAGGWLVATVYRALTHNSIAHVRGPPSASRLLGMSFLTTILRHVY